MVELNGGKPAMRFRIYHEEQEFPVPSPESVPPFNVYAEALRVLAEWRRGKVLPSHAHGVVIECGSAPRRARSFGDGETCEEKPEPQQW